MVTKHARLSDFEEKVRTRLLDYFQSGTCQLPPELVKRAKKTFEDKRF